MYFSIDETLILNRNHISPIAEIEFGITSARFRFLGIFVPPATPTTTGKVILGKLKKEYFMRCRYLTPFYLCVWAFEQARHS